MKPAKFAFARPASLAEAVSTLASAPEDSKVIAGGQSLIPVMNFRLAEPPCLIDVTRIPEIAGIAEAGDAILIGATTRTRAVETSSLVKEELPVLSHAASWVGHVQIRSRGTVGGSIAHGDPAAEMAAMATLLDAEMTVVGPAGTRTVAADSFFEGMMTTVIEPDEILTAIRFPKTDADQAWGFSEYAQRHGDFALAGAACIASSTRPRIVAFGPTDRAVRCSDAEQMLAESDFSPASITEAAVRAMNEVSAQADVYSDEAAHRVRLVRPMVERALRQAIQRKGTDRDL